MHLTRAGLLVAAVGVAAVAVGHALPAGRPPALVEVARPQSSPASDPAATAIAARPAPAPSAPRLTVFVAGEVRRPGVYALAAGARVVDAYRSAGGAAPDADPVAIDLAAPVRDGEEIVVPRRGERPAASAVSGDATVAESAAADDATPVPRHRRRRKRRHRRPAAAEAPAAIGDASAGNPGVEPSRGSGEPPDAPAPSAVPINAASAGELQALPGIGPALAGRIVRYRELNGPFASPAELADVAGMTSGKIDAIAPLVRF